MSNQQLHIYIDAVIMHKMSLSRTINAAPHTYNLQCGGAFVLHVVVFNHGGDGGTRATVSERSSIE